MQGETNFPLQRAFCHSTIVLAAATAVAGSLVVIIALCLLPQLCAVFKDDLWEQHFLEKLQAFADNFAPKVRVKLNFFDVAVLHCPHYKVILVQPGGKHL